MPDALAVDDAWAARDPVMAQLAAAAVAGLPPAGLAERKRLPAAILDGGRPEIVGDLVVQDQGTSRRDPRPKAPSRVRILQKIVTKNTSDNGSGVYDVRRCSEDSSRR